MKGRSDGRDWLLSTASMSPMSGRLAFRHRYFMSGKDGACPIFADMPGGLPKLERDVFVLNLCRMICLFRVTLTLVEISSAGGSATGVAT